MEVGEIYHVYNRGNNKENIFFEPENYAFFLRQFDKYLSAKLDVLAYCLMPNHFHLLIRIRVVAGLSEEHISRSVSKSFKDFLISYAKSINKRYNRTGALFQPKLKKKEVDNDFYFSWIVQYIHLNPIKAGLCKHFSDWVYSSYNAIVSKKASKIFVDEVREWFGGINEFIRIHAQRAIDEKQFAEYIFDD